jgi:hypothetical protein
LPLKISTLAGYALNEHGRPFFLLAFQVVIFSEAMTFLNGCGYR